MKSNIKLKSLKATLTYENDNVICRFTENFAVDEEEAREIFKDCLKWLWLCANAAYDRKEKVESVPPKLAIDDSLAIIDEMWHNFLCFTKEYEAFCKRYLGIFIHHSPTTREYNEELKLQIKKDINIQKNRRKIQYLYIADKLGEEIISRWYNYYGEKYPVNKIRSLRKK